MSNLHNFEEVVRKARADIWGIIINLFSKNIDIDTVIHILSFDKEELEELEETIQGKNTDVARNIAISLAKDANELNLTAPIIEEKTGVAQSEFINFMNQNVGGIDIRKQAKENVGIKAKNRVRARGITKLPESYKSELSKENERAIKLLRSISNNHTCRPMSVRMKFSDFDEIKHLLD